MITINDQRSKIQVYISLHVTKIKIQGYISLHVTEMNDLHCTHFTSFHVAFCIISCHNSHILLHASHTLHAYRTTFHASFHVISYCISHHFMSYFIHFITRITHMSRMSRISHFANSAHFMHYTIRRVILCVISYHFVMKIYITLIHTI